MAQRDEDERVTFRQSDADREKATDETADQIRAIVAPARQARPPVTGTGGAAQYPLRPAAPFNRLYAALLARPTLSRNACQVHRSWFGPPHTVRSLE